MQFRTCETLILKYSSLKQPKTSVSIKIGQFPNETLIISRHLGFKILTKFEKLILVSGVLMTSRSMLSFAEPQSDR